MSATMARIHQGTASDKELINWLEQYNCINGSTNGYIATAKRTEVAMDLLEARCVESGNKIIMSNRRT